MFKSFGSTKEVFANQDEGMFVALPITLDTTIHTLETKTINGRTVAIAGSVVKEGSSVRGILAEDYDVSEGKQPARIVVEGYAWASRLTPNALAAASSLPHIVIMPYKYVFVRLKSVDTTSHKMVVEAAEGAKFASTFSGSDLTITLSDSATASYSVSSDGTELTITASKACNIEITAMALTGFVGATTGSVLKGLPIEDTV